MRIFINMHERNKGLKTSHEVLRDGSAVTVQFSSMNMNGKRSLGSTSMRLTFHPRAKKCLVSLFFLLVY